MRAFGTGKSNDGQTLVFVVFVTAVVIMFVVVLNTTVIRDVRTQVRQSDASFALQASQSGIERALWCLNHAANCPQPYTGETATIGGTWYTTTVTAAGSEKNVTSVGAMNHEERTVSAILTTNAVTTGATFHYGIQAGIGGLVMDQNTIVEGSVYSNGAITGASHATIEADASAAASAALAVDQSQTTYLSPGIVGRATANADAAQSFVASATALLTKVSVNIKKQNGPQNAALRIAQDKGGKPETTSVASWPVVASSITTTLAWYDFTLVKPMPVVAGRKYWIVFDSATTNFLNYWVWGAAGESSYPAGEGMYTSDFAAGMPWNSAGSDFMFKAWTGGTQTSSLTSVEIGHDAFASAITSCTIAHDAYYETLASSTVTGTMFPGSTPPAQVPFPITQEQIAGWEATAAAAAPEVNPNGTLTLGDGATLPSEKINGNLTIENHATVTLEGTVWVKGNLYLDQNAIINLDPAFGSNGTVIVVDNPDAPATSGRITMMNGSTINGTGVTGSYVLVLGTNRSMALGASAAIYMKQGSGGAIFYSTDGIVDIENGVNVKSLTGQALHMNNTAVIGYEFGLIDASFADGPGGAWVLKPETWREVKQRAEQIDITPPSVPQNLKVNGATPEYIWIGWDASVDASGIASYNVYRCMRTTETEPCQPEFYVDTGSSDPQFEDYGVDYYETYEYAVTAKDTVGNESAPSNHITQEVPSGGGGSPIMSKPPI